MDTQKKYVPYLITVVVGVLAFYAGTSYASLSGGRSGQPRGISGNMQNFANLSPEERQQRFQQLGGMMGEQGRRNGQNGMMSGTFANGEIMNNDGKSVTVKLRDGGSKIIFFSDSTKVTKTTDGTSKDLITGKNISVSGTTNSDGSLTAESIQIRPEIRDTQSTGTLEIK